MGGRKSGMNIDDVLSGRAGSQGIRWLLLSTTAKKALADQLRALLPDGAAVRECRLREVRFKPGRKITAYYDVSASPVNLTSRKRHSRTAAPSGRSALN